MTTATDFWSRRKAKVKAEVETERLAAEAGMQKAELAALEEKPDEEILAELDLPDPDHLKAGDDFSAFMKKAVPERLRRRALRKLWVSNPVLANLDGLVDYADDYTDAATVVENLQTSYVVGKGMLAHVLELAKSAEAAPETSENEPEPAKLSNEPASGDGIDGEGILDNEVVSAADISDPTAPVPGEQLLEPPSHGARRMRFAVGSPSARSAAKGVDVR